MKKEKLVTVAAGVLFFILFCITTYPLIFNITTFIPGFFSTDESYVVLWNAWRIKTSFLNQISSKSTDFISYPFGINLYPNNSPYSYLWVFLNEVLSLLTTPVLTYNLQVVLNFILAAFLTYLLVFYLTKNKISGLFSGIAFGFCPYIFVRSWQHLGETFLWPMPLFLWILFRLREDRRLTTKIIFISSAVFTAINYAVSYYTFIITIAFLIYLMPKWKDNKLYVARIFLLSAIASIILIPQFWPIFKNMLFPLPNAPSAWNTYQRPFQDLFEQSARLLSYFLPATSHPIFGKFTEWFIGSPLYGISFTEHTLYLGWTTLILAFIAVRNWRKNRKKTLHERDNYYISFFLFLAVIAWFFSQPPWWKIGPLRIFMPPFFMYKILPMFRAYCRFGIVVMLAVAVLSGFGLKFILEGAKAYKSKIIITLLFCGLIIFEFLNYPPYKVLDVSKFPLVYYWLKDQPQEDTIIAEYPLDADSPNELYKLYQIKHEKKMINGTIPDSYANKVAKAIIKLSEVHTARILKWMGVKYVLVHKDGYLKTGLLEDSEELAKISGNKGLKFIKVFPGQDCDKKGIMCIQKTGQIDVYEVIAQPIRPEAKE